MNKVSQYITKIRTNDGDKQIDYKALANLPNSDTTLATPGAFADSKAVGDALDNMLTKFSNPNLLINSDFRNPINQRGLSSYSYSGSEIMYTIDRWFMNYASAIAVDSGYITLTGNATTNNYWTQGFENTFSGTFTLSVSVKSITGGSGYAYASNNNGSTERLQLSAGVNSLTFSMNNLCKVGFCSLKTGMKANIEWIKLEYGTTATQFVPRQYAEELMLCQRYYRRVYITPMIGSSSTSTTYMLPVQFAPPMIEGYTVTLKEAFDSNMTVQSGVNLVKVTGGAYNTRTIQLSKTVGQYGFVTLVFDSEIYDI